jgi:predicted Rossmann fold nucleotide-binding protein DprA/Smf involved in DNA uptake
MDMHTRSLSPETQVVLLLCGHFSPRESASPLTLREYNQLEEGMKTGDVLLSDLFQGGVSGIDWDAVRLDRARVQSLLDRGAALALAVDKWTSAGLWILSRADDDYPRRLRAHLGRSTPAILFGVGEPASLERGGLAIVGSRDIDDEGEAFTAAVARQCAREGIPVVSGGARGVDQIALTAAFDEGGTVVAALPEGLGRAAVAAKYREGIREERLVLVSPYAPHAPFSVGNAMGRNRLIYALGDAALVVNTSLRSGGTWAGAEEELKRERHRTVYVRTGEGLEANAALVEAGGTPFPSPPWVEGLVGLLQASPTPMSVADGPAAAPVRQSSGMTEAGGTLDSYEAFLPALRLALLVPKTVKELGAELPVTPAQLKVWLGRAENEGEVVRKGRPAKVHAARDPAKQESLF